MKGLPRKSANHVVPAMSEFENQARFAVMVADLIQHAISIGYQITLGDAYRDPRMHGQIGERRGYGSARSFHKRRLAIDLNLFRGGKYLQSTEDHAVLGTWWEAHGGTWGGHFRDSKGRPNPDGNHYSLGEGR